MKIALTELTNKTSISGDPFNTTQRLTKTKETFKLKHLAIHYNIQSK